MSQRFKHISTRPLPYTTKTGIQIGIAYEPPLQSLTPDGEFIQAVLLGNKGSVFPDRKHIGNMLYAFFVAALMGAIFMALSK